MMSRADLVGLVLAFPRWWMAELDAALPDAMRASPRTNQRERLCVTSDEGAVSVALLDRDGRPLFVERTCWAAYTRTMLDQCRRKAAALLQVREVAVSLALPQAVSRTMLIPRRARSQAMQIVRDYIARKIPLPLDEIVIGLDVQAAEAGKLTVNYVALPKTLLERTLEKLGVGACEVALIENGTASAISLAGPQPITASARARFAFAFAVTAIAANVSAFGILAYRQDAVLGALEEGLRLSDRPMRQMAEQTRMAAGLKQDVASFGQWRRVPGVNKVWEELAAILPSTSYLTDLEVTQTGLQLSGFSASTPELIRFLSSSAVFQQAVLSGPITFDQTKGRDHFSIQAALKQPRGPIGGGE